MDFDERLRSALMIARTEAQQYGAAGTQQREVEQALVTVLMTVVTDAGFATIDCIDDQPALQDRLATAMADSLSFSSRKYGAIARYKVNADR